MSDEIERQVDLPVEPGRAWTAVTETGWLQTWLADAVELELWAGGGARFQIDGETRTGWVEEVSPPTDERAGVLAFWWRTGDGPASRVRIELAPIPGGTRLRVAEARPLEVLDLVGAVLGAPGGGGHGPVLLAA